MTRGGYSKHRTSDSKYLKSHPFYPPQGAAPLLGVPVVNTTDLVICVILPDFAAPVTIRGMKVRLD